MSISTSKYRTASAIDVTVSEDTLSARLADGRVISVPLTWFPRLCYGTADERNRWELIGDGEGIHWPDLDEDISVEGLLKGHASGESKKSLVKWFERRGAQFPAELNREAKVSVTASAPLGRAFIEHAMLLLQLHDLMADGRDETDEGERVRDAMDEHWNHLNEREREISRGLSADLYTIGTSRPGGMRQVSPIAFKEFNEAIRRQDWGTTLDIVRENENSLPPAVVAVCRGGSWSHLGLPEVAMRFFEEARRLGDESPLLDVWLAKCYFDSDRKSDALALAERISGDNQASALRVLLAASIFSTLAEVLADPVRTTYRKRAVTLAEQGLRMSATAPPSDTIEQGVLADYEFDAHFNLACDLDALGDIERARVECEKALRLVPDDIHARTLRGVLFDEIDVRKEEMICERKPARLWDKISLRPNSYGALGLESSSVLAG